MKALALSQPWAEFLVSGKKKIEIRGKSTNHRGWFYVYACRKGTIPDIVKKSGFSDMPTGMIIGKAYLSDVKKYSSLEEFNKDVGLHLATEKEMEIEGWTTRMPKYGYIISKAERIKPVPFRGFPGFFNADI